MKTLLSLSIGCVAPENYWTEYPIGLFTSDEEIDAVIRRLFHHGGRFSEAQCQVRIEKVEVIGESDQIACVYRFYGQNLDSSAEGDIVESPCYTEKTTAIQELMKAKVNTPRQEWHMETYIIGRANY